MEEIQYISIHTSYTQSSPDKTTSLKSNLFQSNSYRYYRDYVPFFVLILSSPLPSLPVSTEWTRGAVIRPANLLNSQSRILGIKCKDLPIKSGTECKILVKVKFGIPKQQIIQTHYKYTIYRLYR